MNKIEIDARYEVDIEEYIMRLQIESRVLGDIAGNHVVPTAVGYQNALIKNVKGLKIIFGKDFETHASEQIRLIKKISEHIEAIHSKVEKMINARKKANNIEDIKAKAEAYCFEVKPFFDDIRYHCDKLELMVDDELWPLTKYRELLFTR
jgi:glutamine synthetase